MIMMENMFNFNQLFLEFLKNNNKRNYNKINFLFIVKI